MSAFFYYWILAHGWYPVPIKQKFLASKNTFLKETWIPDCAGMKIDYLLNP
jgi:hypothetical protein